MMAVMVVIMRFCAGLRRRAGLLRFVVPHAPLAAPHYEPVFELEEMFVPPLDEPFVTGVTYLDLITARKRAINTDPQQLLT